MEPRDLSIITEQLGRTPTGALEVIAREKSGQPTVIKVSPLTNEIPFPTLYWLTCPKLKKKISHLEKKGLINQWEKDKKFIEKLKEDHQRYQSMRMSLLKELYSEWKKLPESKLKILRDTGIGGIRNFAHVKCLHLHYAHFLADNNIVGERVHSLLSKP